MRIVQTIKEGVYCGRLMKGLKQLPLKIRPTNYKNYIKKCYFHLNNMF